MSSRLRSSLLLAIFAFAADQQISPQDKYNPAALEAYNTGLELQKAGDKVKALEFFKKALSIETRMIPALMNASVLYVEFKDNANARLTLQRWIEADPKAAKPLSMLAQIEYDAGSRESAVKLVEKAIAMEPVDAEKVKYRDMLSRMQPAAPPVRGSTAKAAAGGAPTKPVGGGQDKSSDGAPAAAGISKSDEDPIAKLEKKLAAAQDGPEKDWLHLMLGIAHFQAQHWKEAREHLTKVLEKDPKNETAREIIKALDKMPSN